MYEYPLIVASVFDASVCEPGRLLYEFRLKIILLRYIVGVSLLCIFVRWRLGAVCGLWLSDYAYVILELPNYGRLAILFLSSFWWLAIRDIFTLLFRS